VREQYGVACCIANGENAAGGFGLTERTANEIFAAGVDVITSGNHIFDKREIRGYLETSERVVRPANYPEGTAGQGVTTFNAGGTIVGVINVMGRVFMQPLDDPFRIANELVDRLRARTNVIVVDVHAEATSEKIALARYLDGRVSLVVGTHTHVQTADEQILAGGTGYLTDAGMTGPSDGVIGMEAKAVLDGFTLAVRERFGVQKTGPRQFCGVVVGVDPQTGRAREIKRVFQRGVA